MAEYDGCKVSHISIDGKDVAEYDECKVSHISEDLG